MQVCLILSSFQRSEVTYTTKHQWRWAVVHCQRLAQDPLYTVIAWVNPPPQSLLSALQGRALYQFDYRAPPDNLIAESCDVRCRHSLQMLNIIRRGFYLLDIKCWRLAAYRTIGGRRNFSRGATFFYGWGQNFSTGDKMTFLRSYSWTQKTRQFSNPGEGTSRTPMAISLISKRTYQIRQLIIRAHQSKVSCVQRLSLR